MLSGSGSSATPINAFKGDVVVDTATAVPSSAQGSSFTITYSNVPALNCHKIITAAACIFYTADLITIG